jgi:hypothetical protein
MLNLPCVLRHCHDTNGYHDTGIVSALMHGQRGDLKAFQELGIGCSLKLGFHGFD